MGMNGSSILLVVVRAWLNATPFFCFEFSGECLVASGERQVFCPSYSLLATRYLLLATALM